MTVSHKGALSLQESATPKTWLHAELHGEPAEESPVGQALRQAAEGHLEEALERLRALVLRRPDCARSRRALAALCYQAGHYDEAIRHGRALLARQPQSRGALDLLYAAYLRQGDAARALRFLESLIRLDPLEPALHFRRGMLLESQGNLFGAARAMARVLDLRPHAELRSEAHLALRLLEEVQLRQIVQLAEEDVLFGLRLRQDPAEAVAERGFFLTADALRVVAELPRESDTTLPGGRFYRFH